MIQIEYWQNDWTRQFLWVVILAFIVCFLLAFGMGANDCANSYGTVVGARVLTLYQAYMMATVFETLGAALLGYKVVNTIKGGIVNLTIYDETFYRNSTEQNYTVVSGTTCKVLFPSNDSDYADKHTCNTSTGVEVLFGELGAITGTAFWLVSASFFKMPVSATQSIVGATVGYSLVLKGNNGINWWEMAEIVGSWVASPLLSGIFSVSFYLFIKFWVFKSERQLDAAISLLPWAFWFTLSVNLFTVFFDGSKYLHFDVITWWQAILISLGIGTIIALFVHFWAGEKIREHALRLYARDIERQSVETSTMKKSGKKKCELMFEHALPKKYVASVYTSSVNPFTTELDSNTPSTSTPINTGSDSVVAVKMHSCNASTELSEEFPKKEEELEVPTTFLRKIFKPLPEDETTVKVFDLLQIVSGSFLAFSHGSNDTANSVGPLVALWLQYKTGQVDGANSAGGDEFLVLMYGVFCMLVGLWILGHKVIETIGSDITSVNAPSGFAMTLGTAFTVLLASKVGIPISTTHCMVGAVIFVGIARTGDTSAVHWGLFRNIAFAWLVTTPVAGIVSAAVTAAFAHWSLHYYS